MKENTFLFVDMFKLAYETIVANKPFATLKPYLDDLSVKSSKQRKPSWDFEIIQYIFNKSLFKVKQSATICVTDSGKIEYIYITTIVYKHITEAITYIDSDYRFTFLSENEKHIIYQTPVEKLYVSIMQNPYSNTEHAVRISFGELK